jgi:phosphoglycolate phosphatase-like HAD superfamily hydrolase
MSRRIPKAVLILSLSLGLPLAGCKEPTSESALSALAYAEVLDEVLLSLRVERLAYPALLEELTALQSRLRRETAAWPTAELLTAQGIQPGTPEAERALSDEKPRLDELEAALDRETEDLFAATDPPRPRDDDFDTDLRLLVAFAPRERFDALVRNGLDDRTERLLAEYDLERRTEGLDWHEFVGRLSASLVEYTPLAAAYRRANREIQQKLDVITRYLDELKERENPFAAEQPHE